MGSGLRPGATVFVLSFLFSIPVLAQPAFPVAVFPPGPTSGSPIELFIPIICPVAGQTVDRIDSLIKVHLLPDGLRLCGSVPNIYGHPVDLGPLPPGQYRVEVTLFDRLHAATTFIVRDAARQPFEVHPSAVPAQSPVPLRVRVTLPYNSEFFCVTPEECSALVLRVGGVEVTDKVSDDDGGLWFFPPLRDPGLADLSIQKGEAMIVSRSALYYFDRAAPPEISAFERVLFPVLFASGGANGSKWVSEALVSNPNAWWVETANQIQPVVCITYPCAERIAPYRYERFSGDYPHGAVLYVPRREAPMLSFSLRVRDVSRESDGYGSAVPVVREKDMSRGPLSLLNVPIDPRYRVKLRVYAYEPFPTETNANIGIVSMAIAEAGSDRITDGDGLALRRPCDYRTCPHLPLYKEVDLNPGKRGDFVDIYITESDPSLSPVPYDPPGVLLWAMVTVTNNDTQQVTVITPDGSGGQPYVLPFPLPVHAHQGGASGQQRRARR